MPEVTKHHRLAVARAWPPDQRDTAQGFAACGRFLARASRSFAPSAASRERRRISARISKAIDLSEGKGNPPEATIGYPEPKTLGERLAQHLVMNEAVKRGLVKEKPTESAGRKKAAK